MKVKKNITKIIIVTVITIFCTMISACNKEKDTTPTPVYGIYTYTKDDGQVSKIVLTKKTIKIINDDFENAKLWYAIKKLQSYNEEMKNEGIEIDSDEMNEFIENAMEEVDFERFKEAECEYKTEYMEEDQILNILFCENGEIVTGLFVSCYLQDGTVGFNGGYYTLESEYK